MTTIQKRRGLPLTFTSGVRKIHKNFVVPLTLVSLGISMLGAGVIAAPKTLKITQAYVTAETAASATVIWNTNTASDSLLQYSTTNPVPANAPQVYTGSQVTLHEVQLSGLTPGTLYHYKITSCARRGCVTANGSFETLPSCPDTVPPVSGYWQEAIRSSGARHLILRTAWVYAAHGSNFLLTMLRLAQERSELRVVADRTGTPTSAALIAEATRSILERAAGGSGTWHLTAAGQTTWHGFAVAIIEAAIERGLLARRPRVTPISSAEWPTAAVRPAFSVLDCSRGAQDFGLRLPTWEDELDRALGALATGR